MLTQKQLDSVDELLNTNISYIPDPSMRSTIINHRHAIEMLKKGYLELKLIVEEFTRQNHVYNEKRYCIEQEKKRLEECQIAYVIADEENCSSCPFLDDCQCSFDQHCCIYHPKLHPFKSVTKIELPNYKDIAQ